MKTVAVILFLAIGCLAIIANGSPVRNSTTAEVKKEDASTSRQAAPAAAADDDDDDDDDDDLSDVAGVDYEDDDDDDEAEDDDDDDEDYLERFIDDILGGEDDDDDDDETPSVVEPVQPASPVQNQATALPAAVQSDLNAESAATANLAAESISDVNDSTGSYEDEDVQPEGQAVSSIEGAESVADPVIVNQAASISTPSQTIDNEDDDDDDDDDEDDDLDLDLTEDDESDEEDEEYEEDDAEETDLDDIADIADARRARAMEGETTGYVSAIYVAKYNRFVDNILGRINKILRTNYDPVTVKLASSNTNKNKTKKKKIKTKSKITSRDSNVAQSTTTSNLEIHSTEATTTPVEFVGLQTSRASGTAIKDDKHRATGTKNKKKTPTKTSNKNKVKQTKPKEKTKSRAKATLYGLSSLKRSGNVSVNMMSDHTTIRTKFNLGPLKLKVEKEFGRAAKKELRSATATTAEMSGKLSLRVLHGGAATLHSIRVLQPKQVRVDSPDDHDRTREFVWRRSSHIAHLVSQKLSSATRSMLRPPPITTVIA